MITIQDWLVTIPEEEKHIASATANKIVAMGGAHRMEIAVDRTHDLGCRWKSMADHSCYYRHESVKKAYFNIIDITGGTPTTSAGTCYELKFAYRFFSRGN